MHEIGFSTGAIAKGDFKKGIEMCQGLDAMAHEEHLEII